jgi:hypothetical protein
MTTDDHRHVHRTSDDVAAWLAEDSRRRWARRRARLRAELRVIDGADEHPPQAELPLRPMLVPVDDGGAA